MYSYTAQISNTYIKKESAIWFGFAFGVGFFFLEMTIFLHLAKLNYQSYTL